MKLKYVKGDLIQAADSGFLNVIAHQANCFCKGRHGIAPLIFTAYPAAKKADDATTVGSRRKLGKLSHAWQFFPEVDKEKLDPLWVFNLYGQYHWNQKSKEYVTDYEALSNALQSMKAIIQTRKSLYWEDDKVLRIGFPLIGCGRAGGDWVKVEEMIKNTFAPLKDVDIYIYTLEKLEGKEYMYP